MLRISMKEARQRFKELLDRAEHGEEIVVLRRGEAVARIMSVGKGGRSLPSLAEFRKAIGRKGTPSVGLVRKERDVR